MEQLIHVTKTLHNLLRKMVICVETLNKVSDHSADLNNVKLSNFNNLGLASAAYSLLSTQAIILFCSFLDEYEGYFTPHHLKDVASDRIVFVRKINKPGIDRIKKWTDLRDFRNTFAAHSFRIKGKSFFSQEFREITINIPNGLSEKNLFFGIAELICENIREEFPEVIEVIDKEESMLDKMRFIDIEIDNVAEFNELKKHMSRDNYQYPR